MKDKYEDYLAFVKYDGSSVDEGLLDARKAAEALLGFDEGVRHFLLKAGVEGDFEIPVLIRKGTWEALIPQTLLGWVVAGGSVVATAYATQAANQMAKNDFRDASFGELIQNAVLRLQKVVKIKKHVEGEVPSMLKTSIKNDGYTVILHSKKGTLEVSKADLDDYSDFPQKALSRMASNVAKDRTLKLGVIKDSKVYEEEVSVDDRDYFYMDTVDAIEEILPELTDGLQVALEGNLTRGNQNTNSLGLEYKGHTLTCKPEKGEITMYKQFLFTKCIVYAIVDRAVARQEGKKKPVLLIIKIEGKELPKQKQQDMFNTKS